MNFKIVTVNQKKNYLCVAVPVHREKDENISFTLDHWQGIFLPTPGDLVSVEMECDKIIVDLIRPSGMKSDTFYAIKDLFTGRTMRKMMSRMVNRKNKLINEEQKLITDG